MSINPAIISSASALLGAVAGGGASLAAAVYTQRHQTKLQGFQREVSKREMVYAEFIMSASKTLMKARFQEEPNVGPDEQELVGLLHRMSLFAPQDITLEAEGVIQSIIETSLEPRMDPRSYIAGRLNNSIKDDPLHVFSAACRRDLDALGRAIG